MFSRQVAFQRILVQPLGGTRQTGVDGIGYAGDCGGGKKAPYKGLGIALRCFVRENLGTDDLIIPEN